MKNLFFGSSLKSFVFTSLLVLIPLTSFCGGDSGGGGTSVTLNDGRTLLVDIYQANPNFVDAPASQPVLRPVQLNNGIKIPGLYAMSVSQQDFYPELVAKVTLLKKSSPITAKILSLTLENMTILIENRTKDSDVGSPTSVTYYLDENLKSNVKLFEPVAFFMPQLNGPVIRLSQYKKLGKTSRAALILHEAFRFIEIDSGAPRDQQIQNLTASVLFNPTTAHLDDPHLYQGSLMNEQLIALRFSQMKNKVCELLDAATRWPGAEKVSGLQGAKEDCAQSTASFEHADKVWRIIDGNSGTGFGSERYSELRKASQGYYLSTMNNRFSDSNTLIRRTSFELRYFGIEF